MFSQGLVTVGNQVNKAIVEVKARMASARHDTVDRVTRYQTKYRPTADKYNKWCLPSTVPSPPSRPLPIVHAYTHTHTHTVHVPSLGFAVNDHEVPP